MIVRESSKSPSSLPFDAKHLLHISFLIFLFVGITTVAVSEAVFFSAKYSELFSPTSYLFFASRVTWQFPQQDLSKRLEKLLCDSLSRRRFVVAFISHLLLLDVCVSRLHS